MADTIAFCWASGLIQFGDQVPEGAIEIARGDDQVVREIIEVTSRHAYDGKVAPGARHTRGKTRRKALKPPRKVRSLDRLARQRVVPGFHGRRVTCLPTWSL